MADDKKSELNRWTSISLAMNIALFILKLITGMFVMSIAIISEAIDSGIDVAASSVARASAKKALQPPDDDHQYGHGKYENMGAMIEAGLIIITAIIIIYSGYYRLTHDFELMMVDIGIVVLLGSVVAKLIVSRKMKELASKHDSMVARAEALNLGTDVYMTIFLPTAQAGRVRIGAEARLVFDALSDITVPAKVSFVAPDAQFTPKQVETRTEREKLMFRIKVKIDPELLMEHLKEVKTGVPGVAYVRLDPESEWPEDIKRRSLP